MKKFVNLWANGCDANLQIETIAGNAVVSLKVSLGQAKHLPGENLDASGCRGGSPSRQRRRARRAEARQSQSTEEVPI